MAEEISIDEFIRQRAAAFAPEPEEEDAISTYIQQRASAFAAPEPEGPPRAVELPYTLPEQPKMGVGEELKLLGQQALASMGMIPAVPWEPDPSFDPTKMTAKEKRSMYLWGLAGAKGPPPVGALVKPGPRILEEKYKPRFVPYARTVPSIGNLILLGPIGVKLWKGQKVSDDEALALAEYMVDYGRERTFVAGIIDMAADMPAFMGEILGPQVLLGIGKKAAVTAAEKVATKKAFAWLGTKTGRRILERRLAKLGTEAAEEAVERGVLKRVTRAGVRGLVLGTAATPIAGGLTIWEKFLREQLPQLRLNTNQAGRVFAITAVGPGEDDWPAIRTAVGSTWAEILGEHMGRIFPAAVPAPVRTAVRNQLGRVAFIRAFIKTNPGAKLSTVEKMIQKAQWQGIFNEWGEEWITRGLEPLATGKPFRMPTGEQLAQEMASIALAGGGLAAAGAFGRTVEAPAEAVPEAPVEAVAPTEAVPEVKEVIEEAPAEAAPPAAEALPIQNFYHGAGKQGVTTIKATASGDFGTGGIYLTPRRDIAAGYARARSVETGEQGEVLQAQIKSQNILNIGSENAVEWRQRMQKELASRGIKPAKAEGVRGWPKLLQKHLKDQGYDGVANLDAEHPQVAIFDPADVTVIGRLPSAEPAPEVEEAIEEAPAEAVAAEAVPPAPEAVAEVTAPQVYMRRDEVRPQTPQEAAWTGGTTPYMVFEDPKRTGELLKGRPLDVQELPETLYHVSSNKSAVEAEGVLRARAGMEFGGLGGGGQGASVSFTTSREDAEFIQRELQRITKIARGDIKGKEIQTFVEEDIKLAGLKGEDAAKLRRLWTDALKHEKVGVEQEYIGTPAYYFGAYGRYRIMREGAKGPPDPIIFGRAKSFAQFEPTNIGILEVSREQIPAEALARGQLSGRDFLHEVAVHGDVPLEAPEAVAAPQAPSPPAEVAPRAAAPEAPPPMGKADLLVRYDEPGAEPPSVDKPQGLYTTPAAAESPHQMLGGQPSFWRQNPDAKVLDVSDVEGRNIVMRRGAVDAGAGVAAVYKLLGPAEFNRLKSLRRAELVSYAESRFPNVDFSRYFDSQEVMEGIGGMLARQEGYDAISCTGRDPQWSEYVALTENAMTPVKAPPPEAPPAPQITRQSRRAANAADLAADYKARGIERQEAWSRFVQDKGLDPGMDAKEFYRIYDTVTPSLFEAQAVVGEIQPTHIITYKRDMFDALPKRVQITDMTDTRVEWVDEQGATGADFTEYIESLTPISTEAVPEGLPEAPPAPEVAAPPVAVAEEAPPEVPPPPGVPVPPAYPPIAGVAPAYQRVIDALKRAKSLRREQEAIYTRERGKRIARATEAREAIRGKAGAIAAKSALKGEMDKVEFESIAGELTPEDMDSLFNMVTDSPDLNNWQKISAHEGLLKLFGEAGGAVPQQGQLNLLGRVFPPEFIKEVRKRRPLWRKVKEAGLQLTNMPKTIMSTFLDFSFGFRQGMFLLPRYRRQWFNSWKRQFGWFGSERMYQACMQEIYGRPTYELMLTGELPMTEMDAEVEKREEEQRSQWAEKIPVAGRLVRMTARAYNGFANRSRADVFDFLVANARKAGYDPDSDIHLLKSLGRFIGAATGRAKMPADLEKAIVVLNNGLWSPRLIASRLSLMNPVFYIRLHPFVRKEALKALLSFTAMVTTILALVKIGGEQYGIEAGTNPLSADFGKIKFRGVVRVDITGGFAQYIRSAAQIGRGIVISSTTGKEIKLGEGYRPLTRYDIALRQLEYKTAPIVSFSINMMRAKDWQGQPISVPKEAGKIFTPMVASDLYELLEEDPELLPIGAAAIFGATVQTYGPKPTATRLEQLRRARQRERTGGKTRLERIREQRQR